VQIGVRFVFPLVVLAYVAVAVAVARGWAEGPRAVPRWVVAGQKAAQGGTAAGVWPHGLSYFNQAWGGTTSGSMLLHGSDYDWGQGLPELRAWNAAHNGGEPLGLWYFGTDPDAHKWPFAWRNTSWLPVAEGGADDLAGVYPTKYLAVSVSILANNPAPTPPHRVRLEWVKSRTPVARTTHFVIYQLRE
ncbi:MAG: hypothetical protein K2V38_23950, partial [Gemmataceae bacterium]|nr:hypothetical protein [Gemmataceae bacterium]